MVSTLKGNNNNNTHINRGKPYAVMLLLAFGAAILGVMILHKIREKPSFSVIIKEKDDQLLNLHLLLQREKEFSKEARKKIEDMKTKIYSLRSQKMELDRKGLEMESTIASLRDERKVIESSLDETKNEIKVLKEGRMNSSSGFLLHGASLKEIIKMKEAEIEGLKLQLHQNGEHVSNPKMLGHGNREVNDAEDIITSTASVAVLNGHGNRKQGSSGNGGALVRTDVNTIEEMRIRENESTKAVEASGDPLNHESRASGSGFRERMKNLKGKRSRESGRSRKIGHQNTIYVAQQNNGETTDGSEKRKKEPSKEEKGQVDDENDRPVLVLDGVKQKGEDIISNRSESREASGKLEMMEDIDVDKSGNENEKQQVAEKEEAATEESEDVEETHEPEIDRADIQRFSESEETEDTDF